MFWAKSAFFALLILCPQSLAHSSESNFGSPHYLLQGSFVLEAEPSEHKSENENDTNKASYEVISYLPHSTLVFTRPTEQFPNLGETKEIEKNQYVLSITQHGQRVLIPKKPISIDTLQERFPNLNEQRNKYYIFHTNTSICPDAVSTDCNGPLEIQPGWFVKLTEEYPSSVQLQFKDQGRLFSGYMEEDKFKELKGRGMITDLGVTFPRYIFDRNNVTKISEGVGCGRSQVRIERSIIRQKAGMELSALDWLPFINAQASVDLTDKDIAIVRTHGEGKNTIVAHYKISIKVPTSRRTTRERDFVIGVVMQCANDPRKIPIYIDGMAIQEIRSDGEKLEHGLSVAMDIEDFHNVDEDGLKLVWRKTSKRPFLTSINSPSHFDRALREWTSKIGDTSLANIFLSFWNLTCPSESRGDCRENLQVKTSVP